MARPVRILFVDDEQLILRAIERCVRAASFVCFFSDDPKQAQGIVSEQEIDVVVSDYLMPRVTGMQLLLALARPPTRLVKALLTSDPGPVLLAQLRELDIAWIEKPWRVDDLKQRLQLLEHEALQRRAADQSKLRS